MITLTGLLQTSLSAGIVILAVCLLSKPFKGRYQSKYRKTIWLLISLRLLIPVSGPLRPWTLHIPLKNFVFSGDVPSGTIAVQNYSLHNTSLSGRFLPNPPSSNRQTDQCGLSTPKTAKDQSHGSLSIPYMPSQNQKPDFRRPFIENYAQPDPALNSRTFDTNELFLFIWAAGAAVFAIYHTACYVIFRKKLASQKIPCSDKLLQAAAQTAAELGMQKTPDIQLWPQAHTAPFLAGIIHPCLILPKECYAPEDLHFILKHELTHYAQKDIWYKLLITSAHILHWFNPLVWIMHSMADADLEKSCDEEVLKGLPFSQRKAYSEVILSCISEHNALHPVLSTGCAARTNQIKDRFANILDHPYKRTASCSILGAAFLIFFSSGLIHITQASGQNNTTQSSTIFGLNDTMQSSTMSGLNDSAQSSTMSGLNDSAQSSTISGPDDTARSSATSAGYDSDTAPMKNETADMDDFDKDRALERMHFENAKDLYSLLGLSIGDGQDLAVAKLSEPAGRSYEVIGTADNSPQCLHTYMFYKDCMIIVKDFFEKNNYEEQNGIFEIEISGRHRSYKTSKGIRVGDSLQKVRQKYQDEGLHICSYAEPGMITCIIRDRAEKASVYASREFTYDYGTIDQVAFVLSPVRYQYSNNTPALIFLIHDNKVTRIIMTNINADYP